MRDETRPGAIDQVEEGVRVPNEASYAGRLLAPGRPHKPIHVSSILTHRYEETQVRRLETVRLRSTMILTGLVGELKSVSAEERDLAILEVRPGQSGIAVND